MAKAINISKAPSLISAISLAIASVLFCWFYGLPVMVLGGFSIYQLIKIKSHIGSDNSTTQKKIVLGFVISMAGFLASTLTFVYYVSALINGAIINF